MMRMHRFHLGLLGITLALCGCSGSSSSSGSACVGDSRASSGCDTKQVVLDPCNFIPSATSLDAAVFDGGCPPDATLAAGDLSQALQEQTVAPDKPLAPEKNLGSKKYGFVLLLRDQACHVIGFGCTEADLSTIREIRIAIRNWTAPNQTDLCTPATGGSCTAPATCNAGVCQ